MTKVEMLSLVKIWLKKCVFDVENPNEQSEEQGESQEIQRDFTTYKIIY